jgi:hypothetical protein
MTTVEFTAPWSCSLKKRTAVALVFLTAAMLLGLFGKFDHPLWLLLIVLPPIALSVAFAFSVRGYAVTESEIQIRRGGWITRLPLTGLQSVEGKSDALKGALWLFANAGLFAFVGFWWSKELKLFRVFATDPSRIVVLRYPRTRIAITPHDPQRFIVCARTLLKTAAFPP